MQARRSRFVFEKKLTVDSSKRVDLCGIVLFQKQAQLPAHVYESMSLVSGVSEVARRMKDIAAEVDYESAHPPWHCVLKVCVHRASLGLNDNTHRHNRLTKGTLFSNEIGNCTYSTQALSIDLRNDFGGHKRYYTLTNGIKEKVNVQRTVSVNLCGKLCHQNITGIKSHTNYQRFRLQWWWKNQNWTQSM